MNKWIDSTFPFVEIELFSENKKSGVAIKPNDFKDRGHIVIHKGDVLENGQLDIAPRNSRYVSNDYAITKKNGIVDSSFLVVSLRDLVPLAPQLGLICSLPDGKQALLAQGTYAFKVDASKVSSKYLSILSNCDEFRTLMRVKSVGSTQVHLRSTEFFEVKIPLPEIEVQKKIVSIIETVENNINQTLGVIRKLQNIKTGMMQDLLTRGIAKNGKLRTSFEEEPRLYRESTLGMIPKEWSVLVLDDIVDKYLDFRGRTPKKLNMEWGGGEIRALSANNVSMGFIDFKKECYLGSTELYKKWMNRGDCSFGDVVMTMEAPLGNIAQIPDNSKYILSQRTILLKTKKDLVSNDFLFYKLLSETFQRELLKNATGSTVQGIQQKKLKHIRLLLPSLDEQNLISEKLKSIDNNIKEETSELVKLKKIKKGLTQDLLTGKVQVKA